MAKNDLVFNTGCIGEARALVLKYHYSHRWATNLQLCTTMHHKGGLFGDIGEACAACIMASPAATWSRKVWELSRLVRNDLLVPLTPLISFACKQAKIRGADLVVSYADATHGHHGGIYQASSWHYHGMRKSYRDGVIVGGSFYPSRSCRTKWGTDRPDDLSNILRVPVLAHMDKGKHLYWRALNKKGSRKAVDLSLESKPYPKPIMLGSESIGA